MFFSRSKLTTLGIAALALSGAGMISGCATITGGTKTNLSVDTEPDGATATVRTQQCETPCTMAVSRDASDIRLEKPGYKSANLKLDKSFRGVPTILGNILWLVPGLAVDFITGGAYDLRPVDVDLQGTGDNARIELKLEPVGSEEADSKEDDADESGPRGSP